MFSMEFIQSIDWPEWGFPGRMRPTFNEDGFVTGVEIKC
jgi:hypothetical protein